MKDIEIETDEDAAQEISSDVEDEHDIEVYEDLSGNSDKDRGRYRELVISNESTGNPRTDCVLGQMLF